MILHIRSRMLLRSITHSICTLEFEDHRPLYDWVVRECEFDHPPRQIEFAKLYLTNVVTGKRYIKKLVEDGIVDGWDDPRSGFHRSTAEEEDLHRNLSKCSWNCVVCQRATALWIMRC